MLPTAASLPAIDPRHTASSLRPVGVIVGACIGLAVPPD
jgi:hypothetical protein